jgi:hypothetical protein
MMSRHTVGVACQVVAGAVAVAGLIPAAVVLNPWRKLDPMEPTGAYFGTDVLKSALVALAGIAVGYVLLRLGSHLKNKRGSIA